VNIIHSCQSSYHNGAKDMTEQTFVRSHSANWLDLTQFPGTQLLPLAEPVPEGSIHLLKMKAGTTIPLHTHPCDEYVYVLSGIVETGGVSCSQGTFWITPANTQQGSHKAITDVEIITIRLGEMGIFESIP
jgi:anti-sigma factor ChrR (cupin superfamily)